ncbi:hypothetical protein [Fodinibius roseus]|uniref:hypothetical protein n=1 Tax=Fodinibius roseus TaxID=1194090 RepID=UPI001479DD0E|nr:hypothetical protein [Fodinibius roseus]
MSWIIFSTGVSALWVGEHALAFSILYGGVAGIFLSVLYGWIDELTIRHHGA